MPNTVQKRRFNRMDVLHPATLTCRSLGVAVGEIRDFSANGVLFALTRPTAASGLQGQPVTLVFKSNQLGTLQYRLAGRVARVFDRSIGIAIDDFPADAYRALAQLVSGPAQRGPAGFSEYGVERIAAVNAECQAQFGRFINQVVNHFFASLNGKLTSYEMTEASPTQRWALRNAYPLLMARRLDIEQALHEEPAPEPQAATSKQDEKLTLALVDTEEFDDWLAVSQLIHKLNLDHRAEISAFDLRYAALQGALSVASTGRFSPHRIFLAFHAVLNRFDLSNLVKARVYKIFYESVTVFFEDFYAELNKTVAFVKSATTAAPERASVAARAAVKQSPPEESFQEPSAPAALNHPFAERSAPASDEPSSRPVTIGDYLAGVARQVAAEDGVLQPVAQTALPSQPVELDYGLNQLLWRVNFLLTNADAAPSLQVLNEAVMGWPSREVPVAFFAGGAMPPIYELPGRARSKVNFLALPSRTSEPGSDCRRAPADCVAPLLSIVNGISQRRANRTEAQNEASVKTQLMGVLVHVENPDLVNPLVQTINSLDEAIHVPGSSEVLNSEIAGLLKKIELPLIKLALIQLDFFYTGPHPVQQTVNLIERFHAAVDDAGKFLDRRLHRLLDLLINQIVDQFEGNTHVFDEVNKLLVTLLAPIEEARKNKIGQIQDAFEQRERLVSGIASESAIVGDADKLDADLATAVELMGQGDWISVATDGATAMFQLVALGSGGQPFLFVNRAATTLREYTRQGLYDALAARETWLSPEYDLPFLERSAYKDMLSVYARVCQQATHDPVSGLLNHKALMGHLEALYRREAGRRTGVFLCMLRLDKNNRLGQDVDSGNFEASFGLFLASIGEFLKSSDVFSRLSDTDYVIVLHDSDVETALSTMKEVVAGIEARRIAFQDKYFAVGVHIGISELTDFIDTPQKLLKTASAAAAIAKTQGGNWVEIYRPDNKRIEHEVSMFEWAGSIDQMLRDDALFLRCQKIQPIGAGDGRLPHYEILLGLPNVPAMNTQGFVLAAEKWHRSADIDLWILQSSFAWLRKQGVKLDALGGISINLSAQSLSNQQVALLIKQNLEADPVLAAKIIFEITETALIRNLESAQQFIEAVRGYGCRFSLDDFGSGYNSFAYLRTLSLDFIKIDGAFVRDILQSPADFAIVKCMHDVAVALGLKTVAEYVETTGILEKLNELGVHYAQGYAIEMSKPISELTL